VLIATLGCHDPNADLQSHAPGWGYQGLLALHSKKPARSYRKLLKHLRLSKKLADAVPQPLEEQRFASSRILGLAAQ
jgi:hypothetical protein